MPTREYPYVRISLLLLSRTCELFKIDLFISYIYIYHGYFSYYSHTHPVYEIAAEVLKMRTDCQGHSDAVGVATPPLNMSHPKTSKDYTMARGVGVYGLKKNRKYICY